MVNNECVNNDHDIHVPPIRNSLWIIEFDVKDKGKGCAVAKASNPEQAFTLLKTQGVFNGSPNVYRVTRIEEIIESPQPMLICEQVAEYNKK